MSKKDKIIRGSIFLLFIMLPIIDCLRKLSVKDFNILGVSVIELFYFVIVGYTLILTLFRLKNKKNILWLLIYSLILLLYLYFHNVNILKFNSEIFTHSNVNIITESYYILRTYYMPVLLLFILMNNRDIFNLKFYSKVIKVLVCMICLSIILLNIFKLSYASYEVENNEFVKYNIFDFYKSDAEPKLLSTRGWFSSANEMSAILMILFPLNIYLLYKEDKKYNIFLYIVQFLGMIILGTRVASLGSILITAVSIVINIFAIVIKHNKINRKLIICGIICTLYFFISPVGVHLLNFKAPNFISDDEYSENLKKLNDKEEIGRYIGENLYHFRINEDIAYIYPIENDVDFWYNIALGDRNINNNFRILKTKIIERVSERNNNKIDKYLGMGYTINFLDVERDYVYQYYLFGIFGVILIFPQIVCYIKSGILMLKDIKKKNIMYKLLILMPPMLGFVVAYYSGHVFGWISPSYVLVLVISILYCFVKDGDSFAKG